jgi:hypothetical protein
MTTEQVNKSISQMRQVFGFFGILTALSILGALFPSSHAMSSTGPSLFVIIWCACLWMAFNGLGNRTPTGLTFARICSFIFVLALPFLTIFGVIYLRKLSKPEMKQAFGAA